MSISSSDHQQSVTDYVADIQGLSSQLLDTVRTISADVSSKVLSVDNIENGAESRIMEVITAFDCYNNCILLSYTLSVALLLPFSVW